MNSKIIGNRNKIIYKKLENKKFQLTRLSIKKIKNQKKIEKKRKTEVITNYNKSPMKTKIIDNNYINTNIKSVQVNDSKKIKNKKEKKKFKDKEKSSLLNINIKKIINPKESNSVRGNDKPASSIIDSIKTYKSNSNNNHYTTNKKSINLFSEKEPFKKFKNKRFVSDIDKKNNTNQYFKINISSTTTKNKNNKNKNGMLGLKEIKIIKMNNKDNNFINKDTKKINQNNIKTKNQNSNKKTNINIIKERNYNKFNNLNVKNMLKSKTQINTYKNNKEEICKNNNNLNDTNKNENKLVYSKDLTLINKQNLNPVKKSLFSEHMNFLNNFNEEINTNQVQTKNDKFLNLNYLNIPINTILQSTENKEFESKFINYDLGIISGSSQIKDSLIAFGKDETHGNIKKNNLLEKNNFFNGEKERTKEELEKLAIQYLNISKNLGNKNRFYKTDESQTHTITTIIDNNVNDDIF